MRFPIVCVGALAAAAAYAQALPHLEKRGQATQLMVDGKPFLMLAGELNNIVSSDTETMRAVWPALARRVIMVQVENEVGLLGDARDRSAAARK